MIQSDLTSVCDAHHVRSSRACAPRWSISPCIGVNVIGKRGERWGEGLVAPRRDSTEERGLLEKTRSLLTTLRHMARVSGETSPRVQVRIIE